MKKPYYLTDKESLDLVFPEDPIKEESKELLDDVNVRTNMSIDQIKHLAEVLNFMYTPENFLKSYYRMRREKLTTLTYSFNISKDMLIELSNYTDNLLVFSRFTAFTEDTSSVFKDQFTKEELIDFIKIILEKFKSDNIFSKLHFMENFLTYEVLSFDEDDDELRKYVTKVYCDFIFELSKMNFESYDGESLRSKRKKFRFFNDFMMRHIRTTKEPIPREFVDKFLDLLPSEFLYLYMRRDFNKNKDLYKFTVDAFEYRLKRLIKTEFGFIENSGMEVDVKIKNLENKILLDFCGENKEDDTQDCELADWGDAY